MQASDLFFSIKNFDQQKLKLISEELNIKAEASNEKAKIKGSGNIKLEGDNCRIDVEAENGTIRTYIINYQKDKKEINTDNTNKDEDNKFINNVNSNIDKIDDANDKIENNNNF